MAEPLDLRGLAQKTEHTEAIQANAEANRMEPHERCPVTANEFTGGTRGRVAYLDTRE